MRTAYTRSARAQYSGRVFGNVGWGEFVVILIAALVILGPERLPGAISWVSKSLRQMRDYASGATQQLKDEFGPEFDDLRKPLAELNQLRGMSPRAAITKHLLDGDDSIFNSFEDPRRTSSGSGSPGVSGAGTSAPDVRSGEPATDALKLGVARPPIDPDAT